MIDNCEWCGKFVADHLGYNCLCQKCNDTMVAETTEVDLGIGNGQICQADEYYCRHCMQYWPMTETIYNALYGVVEK